MITYKIINPNQGNVIFFFGGIKATSAKWSKEFKSEQSRFTGIYFDTPVGGWNLTYRVEIGNIIKYFTDDEDKETIGFGNSSGACFVLSMAALGYFDQVYSVSGSMYDYVIPIVPQGDVVVNMLNGDIDNKVPLNGIHIGKIFLRPVKESFQLLVGNFSCNETFISGTNTTLQYCWKTLNGLYIVHGVGHGIWTGYKKAIKVSGGNLVKETIDKLLK